MRAGKFLVEGTEFSFHDEAYLKAGISPAITCRNAVCLHFRLAHNSFITSYYIKSVENGTALSARKNIMDLRDGLFAGNKEISVKINNLVS